MIQRTLKTFSFLLLVFFLSGAEKITAQEKADHLVISRVCLNNHEKSKSWIEIYNPTDKELILERFRLSNVRTINVLPDSIKKEGGIKVGAGEYVVLCADENHFNSTYGSIKSVCIKALAHIASGGFLAIITKGTGDAKGTIVRYGKGEYSSKIAIVAGDQVVGFSDAGKSYTRKIVKSSNDIIISDFTESSADPGNPNN